MKLGLIYGFTKTNHLLIRPQVWDDDRPIPRLGTEVVDADLKKLGKITDIFGPVSRPFFSVTPSRSVDVSSFSSRTGDPVYIMRSSVRKRRGGKNPSVKFKFSRTDNYPVREGKNGGNAGRRPHKKTILKNNKRTDDAGGSVRTVSINGRCPRINNHKSAAFVKKTGYMSKEFPPN